MSDPFRLLIELRERGFILDERSSDSVAISGPDDLTDEDLDAAAEAVRPHKKWFTWILAMERIGRCRVVGVEINKRTGKRSYSFGDHRR